MPNEAKKRLELSLGERLIPISWYSGTSSEDLWRTIREAFGIPATTRLVLRDSDGDIVTLSESLPSGLRLKVEVTEAASPERVQEVPGPIPAPGPKPYPLVGNLIQMASLGRRKGLTGGILELVREYGDFVRLRVKGLDVFICANPDT